MGVTANHTLTKLRQGLSIRALFLMLIVAISFIGILISNNSRIQQDATSQSFHKQEELEFDTSNPAQIYRWFEQQLTSDRWNFDNRIFTAIDIIFSNPEEAHQARHLAQDIANGDASKEVLYAFFIKASPNSDVMYSYLSAEIQDILRSADQNVTMRGLKYGWTGSYLLESAMESYESTEEKRFLDLARDTMLEMASKRDSITGLIDEARGRRLKAWGTDNSSVDNPIYTTLVTHTGRIATNMAHYSWIVMNNDSLNKAHRAASERLLSVSKQALREFDSNYHTSDDGNYGYYFRKSISDIEPLNHQTSIGQAYQYIAEVDGGSYWMKRAKQISEFARRCVYKDQNNHLVWQYNSDPSRPDGSRPEPIWKGQVTIRFFKQSANLNQIINQRMVKSIANSLQQNIFRDNGDINSLLSNEFESLYEYENHRHGGLENITPYYILNKYSSRLGDLIETTLSENPKFNGWLSSPKTSIAYAYRLGSN